MSRPTIEDDSKLSQSLPAVRCTSAEKSLIIKRAAQVDLSLSEYIRSMALKGQIIVRQSSTDFETISQLKKIGVNLNHQMKKFNATSKLSFELLDVNKKIQTPIEKMTGKRKVLTQELENLKKTLENIDSRIKEQDNALELKQQQTKPNQDEQQEQIKKRMAEIKRKQGRSGNPDKEPGQER